jgi:8-oxo-dGTP pyrophosphatase MutT (NUDIX family)
VREDKITHPSGDDGVYAYIEVKDSVVIVAINSQNEIFMTRNFRYPVKEWGWELPGGGGETGEEMLETSKRELAEEAGLASDNWHVLGTTLVWNGLATEKQNSLLACNVYGIKRPKSDDEHMIKDGQFFPFDKVRAMIKSGEIADNQTLTALYLAELSITTKGEK